MNRSIAIVATAALVLAFSAVADIASAQVIRRAYSAPQQTAAVQQTYPAVQGQQNNGEQTNGQQSASQHDYFIASWIGADNLVGIELNQFGEQHASSQEVKNFAQEMVRSHTDLANKINQAIANENEANANTAGTNNRQRYAAGYRGVQGSTPAANEGANASNDAGQANAAKTAPPQSPATNDAGGQANTTKSAAPQPTITNEAGGQTNIENKNQPNNTNVQANGQQTNGQQGQAAVQSNNSQASNQAENQPGQPNGTTTFQTSSNASVASMPGMKAINLKREINDDLVRRVEEKLGQKQGEDFDRCFMVGEVVGHERMLATLEVARNQVSPQLKPVLDEAVETAQKHLNHAETVLKQLEQNQKK